jgi:serine/threonine protein kinase
VFQATEKYSGRRVAIKRVRLRMYVLHLFLIFFLLYVRVFSKYRGTEQDVLEELKILCKLDHNNILRYHNSWSEPIEYHKERDEILFDQFGITASLPSATDEASSQIGRTCNDYVELQCAPANDSDDMGIIFEPSSRNNQSVKSTSKFSIDDKLSTQNDQTEEKLQKRSKSYEYFFIVTSLCKKESLEHRLLPEYRSENKLNRFDALYIFYQIVEGVRYLHNTMNMVTNFLILVLLAILVLFYMILLRFIVI